MGDDDIYDKVDDDVISYGEWRDKVSSVKVGNNVIQGWDSCTFMSISVEQKLKSMVDDDYFCGEKKLTKKHTKKLGNPSP